MDSGYYDLQGFSMGRTTLREIELKQLGDISGKELIHLQCHIGLDSMSLSRDLGAIVCGIDYSENSIAIARKYAQQLGIQCNFHCLPIGEVYHSLKREFDIVYTSYGVLTWIEDLDEWAREIANLLKVGGTFHLIDEHPFTCIFSGEKNQGLQISYPYFRGEVPYMTHNEYSYSQDGEKLLNQVQYKWGHSFSEILMSLISAGLLVEHIEEHHKSFYNMLPNMEQGPDGWWYLLENADSLPLILSLKAKKI